MLQEIDHLYGLKLSATDKDIGHIDDFYFDDHSWLSRYIVVDTGSWLNSRQVLLAPEAFTADALNHGNATAKHIQVNLTSKQIENSPSIVTHRTVSRQYEDEYYRYYGWPNYWESGMLGAPGLTAFTPDLFGGSDVVHPRHQGGDPHLHGTRDITGYMIHALDGELGTVSGFMVNSKTWGLHVVIIETGAWYKSQSFHLLTEHIIRISHEKSMVYVNVTIADLTRNVHR